MQSQNAQTQTPPTQILNLNNNHTALIINQKTKITNHQQTNNT